MRMCGRTAADERGDDVAEFLRGGGTGVVIDIALDRDGAELRRVFNRVVRERGHVVEAGLERLMERALGDEFTERIIFKSTAKL